MMHLVMVFGFLIRLAVAIWNGFFGPSIGADFDAESFHLIASEISQSGNFEDFQIGTAPYVNFLGMFYKLTTNSLFLGSALSCVVWLISFFTIKNCSELLNIGVKDKARILLIYCLSPSSIIYTSITLRESYQLLFTVMATYAILKYLTTENKIFWLPFAGAILFLSLLHGGLFAYSVLSVVGLIFFKSKFKAKKMNSMKTFFLYFIGFGIVSVAIILFENSAYNIEGDFGVAVATYQNGVLGADGRTNYKSDVGVIGIFDLLFLMPVTFFQYLLEPLPWHVATTGDAVLMIENVFRIILIKMACGNFEFRQVSNKNYGLYIFYCYVIMELIWSVGTVNWGTAARHHVPSIGLLLLAAFSSRSKRFIKKT